MRSTRPHLPAFRLLAVAALLSLAGASFAQKIEQQMTQEQFKATGLDRLSPEQLANLNDWLDGKLKLETAKAVETAKQASDDDDHRGLFSAESREPITGKLSNFSGFGRGRSYTLDNGQVWQQIDDVVISGVNNPNPQVRISPSLVGTTWYLSVDGFNIRAKVQRVK
ncbi:MAG TPA: hypothetical protein VIT90_02785 [Lysobacter sp.]